jgi:hypothetical protein
MENDLGGLNRSLSSNSSVIDRKAQNTAGGLLLQKWLSPPDPSINFNTARKVYHEGTAAWFTQGSTFKRWKSESSQSMLWVHGKRISLPLTVTWLMLILPSYLDSWVW